MKEIHIWTSRSLFNEGKDDMTDIVHEGKRWIIDALQEKEDEIHDIERRSSTGS